jgi:hypothetical protein
MSPIFPGIIASQITGHLVTGSYESIATVTVGAGGQSSISFSSIPSTYKHLQIRAVMRDTSGTTGYGETDIRLNNNSGGASSYVKHYLRGNGTAASAGYFSNGDDLYGSSYPRGGSYTGVFGAQIIDILDYTNTNKNKTIRVLGGFDGNGAGEISLWSGLYFANTNAITQIDIFPNQTGFAQYSSFALYGVKG